MQSQKKKKQSHQPWRRYGGDTSFTGQKQFINVLKENLKLARILFYYFTISHLVFELFDVNTPTGQEIRFELKMFELNCIRLKRCNYRGTSQPTT